MNFKEYSNKKNDDLFSQHNVDRKVLATFSFMSKDFVRKIWAIQSVTKKMQLWILFLLVFLMVFRYMYIDSRVPMTKLSESEIERFRRNGDVIRSLEGLVINQARMIITLKSEVQAKTNDSKAEKLTRETLDNQKVLLKKKKKYGEQIKILTKKVANHYSNDDTSEPESFPNYIWDGSTPIPATSAWCSGNKRANRVCRFKNLCYFPEEDRFIFIKDNQSVIENAPDEEQQRLLELTTVGNHNLFFFSFDEVKKEFFADKQLKVEFINEMTFIFSRFHLGNIMHTIHDELINLYFHLKEHSQLDISIRNKVPNDNSPFSLKHHLQMVDGHDVGDHSYLFKFFSDYPLRFMSDLRKTDSITCFRDSVVGLSRIANWYQYGFGRPQGPIQGKNVSGIHVRQFVHYLESKLKLPPVQGEPDLIVLFSRQSNRLLLNEKELLEALQNKFNLSVEIVQMESHTFEDQVRILRRSKIAIGLHGSILIMGMFLPPGSILIELYPYAIPSGNYTPYRTMAQLPGMDLVYRAWENTHEENNVMYPNRSRAEGGISHLPIEEQETIMNSKTVLEHHCCADPNWLFRIYQDTTVHIPEVLKLIDDAWDEGMHIRKKFYDNHEQINIIPSTLGKIECHSSTDNSITISWRSPWNHAKITNYSIWVHETAREYFSTETVFTLYQLLPNTTYSFWVRPTQDDFVGSYTPRKRCNTTILDYQSDYVSFPENQIPIN